MDGPDRCGRPEEEGADESPELLATYYTKRTPVYALRFTGENVLLAGGAYVAQQRAATLGVWEDEGALGADGGEVSQASKYAAGAGAAAAANGDDGGDVKMNNK